jgi:hypothetical protein
VPTKVTFPPSWKLGDRGGISLDVYISKRCCLRQIFLGLKVEKSSDKPCSSKGFIYI